MTNISSRLPKIVTFTRRKAPSTRRTVALRSHWDENPMFKLILLTLFASVTLHAETRACGSLFLEPTKHEIQISLALKAGLTYSPTKGPGLSREGTAGNFIYRDSSGRIVQDPETLDRIAALALPPAYHDVWISEDPLSHVQATAKDDRGRTQSRYHKIWDNEVRPTSKFQRMKEFGHEISRLRELVNSDLNKTVIDQNSQLAAVERLLEISGIRIGSEQYARAEVGASYGLATLQVKHVQIDGSKIRFQFVAKEGIPQDIVVEDAGVARVVNFLIETKSPDQDIFDVNTSMINSYIKAHTGPNFSAKDFRTWVGTAKAAKVLHEIGPLSDQKSQDQALKTASVAVSNELHNTPSVAIKYYINPMVFEAYLTGKLEEAFQAPIFDPLLSDEENAVLFLTK